MNIIGTCIIESCIVFVFRLCRACVTFVLYLCCACAVLVWHLCCACVTHSFTLTSCHNM